MDRRLLPPLLVLSAATPATAAPPADWSAPTPLPTQPRDVASSMFIGDPLGHSAFAAAASRGRSATLRVTLRDPGGTFSPPLRVPATLSSADRDFGIALDGAGRARVAFTGRRGGRAVVLFTGCARNRCSRPQIVGSPDLLGAEPQVGVDRRRRRTLVLWRGISHHRTRLQWRISTSRGFGGVHTLGEDGHDARLAYDNKGAFIAVWRSGGARPVIRAAQFKGGRFSRPRTVSPAGKPASQPTLAVASNGRALVVWRQSRPDGEGTLRAGPVGGAERPAGGSFAAPALIAPDAHAGAVAAAVSPSGRAVAAWSDFGAIAPSEAETQIVTAALREPGQTFGAPAALSRAAGIYVFPSASVDDAGTAAVAWSEPPRALAATKVPSRVAARLAPAGAPFAPEQTLDAAPTDCTGVACNFPAAAHLVAFGRTTLAAWTTLGGASVASHMTE